MLSNKSTWLIGASCLALILLILFQVNWLRHSRQLLEEQFDQKVSMALCSAVESLQETPVDTTAPAYVSCQKMAGNCYAGYFKTNKSEQELHHALTNSLHRYDIDLNFTFEVADNAAQPLLSPSTFCAKDTPLTLDNHEVYVNFTGKERYLFQQMGAMTGASIFILLFISTMLLFTLLKFLHQKQLNAVSIDFFNNMAHEFRTPLTNMQLALNLYKKRHPYEADSKFLDVIQTENKRLLEQVERMLHVAKLERGEYQLEIEDIDLQTLVNEVVEDMKMSIAARNGVVHVENRSPAPIIIQGDRLHLSNSIRNLIDNALKYCDCTPNLRIRLEQQGNRTSLRFEDNGIGIGERQKHLIFESFRRGTNGDIHDQKGFGLGLAYVKRVIEQHGGTVSLESEVNKGSCFQLSLPLHLKSV
ncbi:MAG: sensor histidine kinase [Saprospiraceae bacterium]